MPVMIVFLSLAVVGLLFYIVMLARPVSYGMTYTWNHIVTEADASIFGEVGSEINMTIKIKNDEKMEQTLSSENNGEPVEAWIVRNGNQFIMIPVTMTEEEYDTFVEELKADEAEWNAIWAGEGEGMPVFNVNAFGINVDLNGVNIDMTCTGAIVFASVFGAVELILITFAILSTIFYIKARKDGTAEDLSDVERIIDSQSN